MRPSSSPRSPRRASAGKYAPSVSPGPLVAQVRALLTPSRFKDVAEYPVVPEKPAPAPRGPFAGLPDDYFVTKEQREAQRLADGHPPPHLPPFPYLTWMERASKLTEMDVRSPGFDVKLSLFVPLLRVAAAKQSQAAADETQPEASTGTKAKLKDTVLALRAIEQCVLEREEERRVGSSQGHTVRDRTLVEQSYRKIVARLIAKLLSVLVSVASPRLVLEQTPPPPTNVEELFPASGTRTMRSTRACHEAWDFLLVASGMRSSRVGSRRCNSRNGSSSTGKNPSDPKEKGALTNTVTNKERGASSKKVKRKKKRAPRKSNDVASAPLTPRAKASSPLAVPGDHTPRSEFDYFGGASISSRQTPIYPESMGSPVREGRSKKASASGGTNDVQAQAERIIALESQLRDSKELNERLISQQKLIDESPESAALALDARRLMLAEARAHQLRRQVDTLLCALEGQTEVVDHAERILLELVDMGSKGLLPKKRATERGESVKARVQNLLERLRASARASARARTEQLQEK